jgi:ADP-heptose:LPS heptosyltransferase
VFPIKRKLNSAVWRLKQAAIGGYNAALKAVVETLAEKYWLLDYLPTFAKRKQGVLLVRLDLIGDFVLWLDSAQAYRQLYPNKKITLAVNSACGELAKALPHWDEVISINVHRLRTDFVYRLRTLVSLRWRNFAIAIQPTFSRELVGDIALRSTNAPQRIGYRGDTNNILTNQKAKSDLWYNKLVVNDRTCKMELSINAHFVRELGCTDFLSALPVIPETTAPATQFDTNKPYIVIAPGASWQPKMWPARHFAELVRQLNAKFDIRFALCGGNDDYLICESLAQDLGFSNLTNLAGKTSLLDLVEIIRRAELVVSNDSSPVHIAAATGATAICILGGGHFGRFLPYQIENSTERWSPHVFWNEMDCFDCRWLCKFKPLHDNVVPCISGVSVENVTTACMAILLNKLDPSSLPSSERHY